MVEVHSLYFNELFKFRKAASLHENVYVDIFKAKYAYLGFKLLS